MRWEYSPAVGLNAVSVSVGPSVFVSGFDGNVYAVDPESGEERWWFATGGSAVLPPVVSGDVVQVGSSDGRIYGVDVANGSERWRTPASGAIRTLTTSAGILYTLGSDGTTAAFDAASGVPRWRVEDDQGDTAIGLLVGTGGGVSVSGGTVRAWDLATGSERWRVGAPIVPKIVVADGLVLIGGADGSLHAVDAVQGMERWRFATGAPVRSDRKSVV